MFQLAYNTELKWTCVLYCWKKIAFNVGMLNIKGNNVRC